MGVGLYILAAPALGRNVWQWPGCLEGCKKEVEYLAVGQQVVEGLVGCQKVVEGLAGCQKVVECLAGGKKVVECLAGGQKVLKCLAGYQNKFENGKSYISVRLTSVESRV